jgi:hypothetical protein
VAAAACALGCLDLEPVEIHSAVPDAGSLAPAAPAIGCGACVQGFSSAGAVCVDEMRACRADPKCDPLLSCLFEVGCFEAHTLDNANRCAFPCVLNAGITSTLEPSIRLMSDIAECGRAKCLDACYSSM